MSSVMTSVPFILRFLEMITSIVAFAVITDASGYSKTNFIIFVGVSGFVLALFYMLWYLSGNKAIRGKASAVLDGLWWCFWLSAAAVATSLMTVDGWRGSRVESCVAFSWISWVLWSLSLVLSIREVQGFEY